MTQQRLPWLLVLLVALALVRWLVPNPLEQPDTAEAVIRPAALKKMDEPVAAVTAHAPAETGQLPHRTGATDFSEFSPSGNAFAVRTPPVVPPPPSPPVQAVVVAATPTPPPSPQLVMSPPPLAPPIQVIGTWDDGTTPGVFVSTPSGTKLARKGTVLIMEYLVTALTPQQMTLQQISSKREVQLSVPRNPGK